MEKNVLGRGLEDISGIFMTQEKESKPLNNTPDNIEIEETINTHKKISISDNRDSQYMFKKLFLQYLEQGYEVSRIDFKKNEECIDSYHRTIEHEEVTIVNKNDTSG